MLNRIRASVAGDNAPDSPRHTLSSQHQQNASAAHTNSPATPQRGLFGFLKPPSVDVPPSAYHHTNNHDRGVTPMGPSAGGFFGGLIGGGAPAAPPSPMEPDSPRTIRASAAALLKFSTTPPLFNAAETSNNNSSNNGSSGDNNAYADEANNKRLGDQINKRDQHIMKLEHDLQKMQHQHSQLIKDNATIRRQQLESTHRHAVAIRLWRRTNDGLSARVDCFERETTPSAAREIAQLIRDAAPPNKDSAYLMMLQDQLSKATTKLDHLASQTEIVLHKGEEVVESLREEMNEVIRERCRMEIELMDQEYMLEEDMKRLVLRAERRLKRVMGEIDFLEKNAVEALKNQEGEEEEEDEEVDGSVAHEEDKEGDDDDGDEGENSRMKDEVGETETKNTINEEEKDNDGDQETDTTTTESTTQQPADEGDENNTASNNKQDDDNKKKKEDEQTPEVLRHELRRIAMERDRCLSVLQKKLRDKNEEFNALMKLKESRTKAIDKIETERREREEWERGRQEMIS